MNTSTKTAANGREQLKEAVFLIRGELESYANLLKTETDPEQRAVIGNEIASLTKELGLEFNQPGAGSDNTAPTQPVKAEAKPSWFARLKAWFVGKYHTAKARPILSGSIAVAAVAAGVGLWYFTRGKVSVVTHGMFKKSMEATVEGSADVVTSPGILTTVVETVSSAASATGNFCVKMFGATKGLMVSIKDTVVGWFGSSAEVASAVPAAA